MALLDILAASAVAVIVAMIVYIALRTQILIHARGLHDGLARIDVEIPRVEHRLQGLESNVSHVVDLVKIAQVPQLQARLEEFGHEVVAKIEATRRLSSEEIARVRADITVLAEERALQAAIDHVRESAVPRDEFDRLREHVSKLMGAEEAPERLELVSQLFTSSDPKVLTWQCKLLKRTESGLAPEAETDLMIADGIPLASAATFLKQARELGILASKKVESFWLQPDFTWLIGYVQDPSWLRNRLENQMKRESEYQRHVRDHIELVEPDLILLAEQYEIPSGKVDIRARDKAGVDVLIELKYPVASSAVVGQLIRYREDVRRSAAGLGVRCIAVAPRIPERVQANLRSNEMEYREVPFE